MKWMFIVLYIALGLTILVVGVKTEAKRYGNTKNEQPIKTSLKEAKQEVSFKTTNNKDFWAKASWYGMETCRKKSVCKMANGQVFNPNEFSTACSKKYKLGTRFKFTYEGKSAEAECTDRGGFERLGRDFDFSYALFSELADTRKGVIKVRVEVLGKQ